MDLSRGLTGSQQHRPRPRLIHGHRVAIASRTALHRESSAARSRSRSAGKSTSAKAVAVVKRPQSPSSTKATSTRVHSARIDRSPDATRATATSRSAADHRAQRGWGCPATTGTTESALGHSARKRTRARSSRGRSHARTITGPICSSSRRAVHPAATATRGPPPAGSSRTATNPQLPGPTSRTGDATSHSTPMRRCLIGSPSITIFALSKPIRRLAPPVRIKPATGGEPRSRSPEPGDEDAAASVMPGVTEFRRGRSLRATPYRRRSEPPAIGLRAHRARQRSPRCGGRLRHSYAPHLGPGLQIVPGEFIGTLCGQWVADWLGVVVHQHEPVRPDQRRPAPRRGPA